MKTSTLDSLMHVSRELSVLFVEDDKHISHDIEEILRDIFSSVLVAENGQEGLEKYLSFHKEYGKYPDIVMTDIVMPYLSGVEMSREILALCPEQAIVVLSASNDTTSVLDLLNMGVEAYVLKPIQYEILIQTLGRVSKKVMHRKMSEAYIKKLESLAYIDPLTGISNRRRFFEKANAFLLSQNPPLSPYTLCIFDIDRFKDINDTYGHDMGDAILCYFVESIKKHLDDKECFARFGGDEFMVIFQRNDNEIKSVLEQIHTDISKSHTLLGKQIYFSVSMGWTQINVKDDNIDVAVKRADLHLYEIKQLKKEAKIEFMI